MLLYLKEKNMIINLDQIRSIFVYEDCGCFEIIVVGTYGEINCICECENEEEAQKVLAKIYINMTYGSGNMILDLEDFRKELRETETAKTRKALKCGTCIYVDTDGCKEWDNDGTGCDVYITKEEAKKDVNEEK